MDPDRGISVWLDEKVDNEYMASLRRRRGNMTSRQGDGLVHGVSSGLWAANPMEADLHNNAGCCRGVVVNGDLPMKGTNHGRGLPSDDSPAISVLPLLTSSSQ